MTPPGHHDGFVPDQQDVDVAALAEALLSGEDIDWQAERSRAQEPRAVDNLQTIQSIITLFGSAGAAESRAPEPTAASFEWGHLRVSGRLGEGTFGEVYRAYDTILEREVALKLRRGQVDGSAYIAEARRLARVRHPNVLAVHGADVHGGRVGLWADLLVGRTFESILRDEGRLPALHVVEVAAELARALEAVHERGIVHGDLKAANVMCEPDGTSILMDFGAGLDLNRPGADGALSGTPLAMAPERLAGAAPAPASDMYSLGVLIYRLLTGRYPVHADTLEALVERHAAVPRLTYPRGVPRAFRRLVQELLDTDPQGRPMAAAAVARLELLRTAPARRRRRFAVAAVVASLSLGTVVATLGFIQARVAEQRAAAVNDFLREILAAPRLVSGGLDVPVREVLDQAQARIQRDQAIPPTLRTEMLTILGSTYWSLGFSEPAAEVLANAVQVADGAFEPSAPEHVGARLALASAQMDAGRGESVKALLTAVADDLAGLPRGHGHRLHYHRVAARLAFHQGDSARSIEETTAAVALRSTPAERDDWAFRLAQWEHALALLTGGRFERAEAELRDLLAWFEARYGRRNTNSLSARFLLAEVLDRQGRSAEAIPMLRETLADTEAWLGPNAYRHGQTLAVLSSALANAGELEEALAMNRAAAENLSASAEGDEFAVATVVNNQGLILTELGRYAEAEQAYREALAALAGVTTKTPTELVAWFNLAEVLLLAQRPAEALDVAAEARPVMVDRVGEDHLFVLVTDGVMGAAQTRLGLLDEGAARLESAVIRARRQLGETNPSTLDNEYYLAHNEWARGATAQATERLQAVLAGRRAVLGEAHPKTRAAAADLAAWTSD